MSLPEKYLVRLGRRKRPHDRRRTWASDARELVEWVKNPQRPEDPHLSKGERHARLRFADLLTGSPTRPPVDPLTAIRDALDLNCGNIPEFENRESFDAYWSHDRLVEISNRWRESRFFRNLARAQVQAAHATLGAAASVAANTLVETCLNEKASTNARVKAAQTILGTVGIIAGSKIEDQAQGKQKALREKGRAVLGNVIPLPMSGLGEG